MPVPGYPLATNKTNDTVEADDHPAHHNAVAGGVNALSVSVDDLNLAAVKTTGDQSIAGTKSFTSSPIVPNPVAPVDPNKAVSLGELQDTIAAEPALAGVNTLYVGPFGNIPTFGQKIVANTVAETTLLGSTPNVPAMPLGSMARAIIAGDIKNNTGANATLTFRFKVAGTTIFTIAQVLPTDAVARPFRYTIDLQNLGSTTCTVSGELVVDPATAPLIHAVKYGLLATQGGATQAWDVTVQWSVANAQATMQRLLANLIYGIAP